MADALTITSLMRFAELRRQFRAMVTSSRRKKLSSIQTHHLAAAASKQQVVEIAIIERALGAKHDRNFIERLKAEVKQHLALAGAHFNDQPSKGKQQC